MSKIHSIFLLVSLFVIPAHSFGQGLDTSKVDSILGRSGTKMGDIYKVGFPRSDLHVTLDGIVLRPGLALGSWGAFAGTNSDAMVMGDLVLLEGEVNLVMVKLREAGFEITAIHNHLLNERPHVMYMHYMGHGTLENLAKSLRSALEASKTPFGKPAARPNPTETSPAFVKITEEVLGRKGSFNNGVLGFGIPRAGIVTHKGRIIPPSLGVAEAINFQEAGKDRVATAGDFVLTADEVTPVISALEAHNIQVTALHNHMLDETPRLFFMHFWGTGEARSVAEGIKAALARIQTK